MQLVTLTSLKKHNGRKKEDKAPFYATFYKDNLTFSENRLTAFMKKPSSFQDSNPSRLDMMASLYHLRRNHHCH